MVAKLEASLRAIPQVGEKGDPITHVEIRLLPPINPLQNVLGVMGVAEYDNVNTLSELIRGEAPEYGDMAPGPAMVPSAASCAQPSRHLHG